MSFSAAELVATIQLGGVSTAERDLERFRGRLNDTDSIASKLGKTAAATFRGAATAVGVATAAAAVYVGKLFSTGVAYNQLQQTSRAALRTLVGGAEQANAQMDKLDAFAKTSPFSKSVFITAQQQLVGFGMAADRVIPTLDAVQNAVAATGGSSQQLSEITYVLAQIQAAGKITGQDLMQLGQRGIDAATLIGSQMGKTGAQIREDITEGALSADDALKYLTAGMAERFKGAASNVKETFSGTVDRVRAASRDIGAALAEPFVSKNGGGLAVTWGNQVADVMRAVEGHTAPVVNMLTARAAPAFVGLTQTLDRARVQVKSWDSSRLESGLNSMAANAPGIAALAGAVVAVNTQMLKGIPVLGSFVPAFGPLGGAIAAAALASPQLRAELGSLLGELKPLVPVTVELATTLSGALNAALPVVAAGIRGVTAVAQPMVAVLEAIPSPILAAVAAGLGINSMLRSGTPLIEGFGKAFDGAREYIAASAAVAEATGGRVSTMGAMFGAAGTAATGLGNSLKAAFISNPVGLIILGVSTAAGVLTAALSAQGEKAKETRERIQGYRETLNQTTGALTDATRAQIEKNLAEKDADDAAKSLKISNAAAAQAILDGGPAYDAMIEKLRGMKEAAREADIEAAKRGERGSDSKKVNDLIGSYENERAAIESAQKAQRAYTEEQRRLASEMSETERSNARLNEAIRIASDVSRDATERINALRQALDELNGGSKSAGDVTQQLNDRVRALDEAFAAADEHGNKLASTLVMASGEIDTQTAAGSALRDQVQGLARDYEDAMRVASDAAHKRGEERLKVEESTAVYERYAEKLRQSASQADLTAEQIDALVSATLAQPEVVATVFASNADEAMVRAVDLATKILATPDKTFTIDDGETIKGIENDLARMGFKITHLEDGRVKVVAEGIETVEQRLANLARTRTSVVRVVQSGGAIKIDGKLITPGMATGGPVVGPGSGTSDTAGLYRLSNGEHVVTAAEVAAAGGHEGMFQIRKALLSGGLASMFPGRAEDGPIYPIRDMGESMLRVAPPASPTAGASLASNSTVVALLEQIVANLDRPNFSFTEVNPVHTDPISERFKAADMRAFVL